MQVHLAHSYSETCGDNTGEMPGLRNNLCIFCVPGVTKR